MQRLKSGPERVLRWQESRRAEEESSVGKKEEQWQCSRQEFGRVMCWQFAWEFDLSDKVNEELT